LKPVKGIRNIILEQAEKHLNSIECQVLNFTPSAYSYCTVMDQTVPLLNQAVTVTLKTTSEG